MPRSGVNGTFTLPGAQATQQPNTTIPSAVNNQGWSDVEQTFNTPQPIAYGGTGATTAVGGADALSTKGADIASAGTTNLAAATGWFVHITGTTTITAFGTAPAGTRRDLVFDAALTLTHNATSLILPGGSNILTAAGDTATAISEGSGNWRIVDYQRAASLVTPNNGGNSLVVNGSMALSQENGNTLGTTNGYYPADQFALYFTAASAAMSVQRVQARTLSNAIDQIEFKTTTAKASLAAGDSVTLTQNIEGSHPGFVAAGFGTANAKPLVLRAQVQRPAGLYHFHFQNSAATRHCAVPYTISAGEANTPVVKTIIVPPDTSGTWLTGDGVIGITVDDVLAVGATKTGGSPSTWSSTAFLAASTQFNILSSTSNVARLADVGLKLDADSAGVYGTYRVNETDAVYRSERYWEKSYNAGVLPGAITQEGMEAVRTGASLAWRVSHKFLKNKNPTITLYNPRTGTATAWDDVSGSVSFTASSSYVGQSGFTVVIPAPVSGNLYGGHWTSNARLS